MMRESELRNVRGQATGIIKNLLTHYLPLPAKHYGTMHGKIEAIVMHRTLTRITTKRCYQTSRGSIPSSVTEHRYAVFCTHHTLVLTSWIHHHQLFQPAFSRAAYEAKWAQHGPHLGVWAPSGNAGRTTSFYGQLKSYLFQLPMFLRWRNKLLWLKQEHSQKNVEGNFEGSHWFWAYFLCISRLLEPDQIPLGFKPGNFFKIRPWIKVSH